MKALNSLYVIQGQIKRLQFSLSFQRWLLLLYSFSAKNIGFAFESIEAFFVRSKLLLRPYLARRAKSQTKQVSKAQTPAINRHNRLKQWYFQASNDGAADKAGRLIRAMQRLTVNNFEIIAPIKKFKWPPIKHRRATPVNTHTHTHGDVTAATFY